MTLRDHDFVDGLPAPKIQAIITAPMTRHLLECPLHSHLIPSLVTDLSFQLRVLEQCQYVLRKGDG